MNRIACSAERRTHPGPNPSLPGSSGAGGELSFDPWWWNAAPLEEPCPRSEALPESADVVVVGAGFTGLAAARTLARGGRDALVLDAGAPGFGASSRNGGMAGSGLRLSLPRLEARYGKRLARRLLLESLEAVDALEKTIRSLEIDCSFSRCGRVVAAWTREHFERLKRHADDIDDLRPGEAEILDQSRLFEQEVASRRYCGGLLLRTHGGLHPAALHRGVLGAARLAGARVRGETPVLRLNSAAGGWDVETPSGTVRAGKVIVATNGYSDGTVRWWRRHLLPVPSYIVVSEPLPADRLARLLPGKRMIVETHPRHAYFRRTPCDSRLMFGGRASVQPIPLPSAARRLHGMIERLFGPEARGLRYSHCWTGWVAFTASQMPHIVERDGVFHAGGYCGNGVALSNYLGTKAAFRLMNDPQGDTAFAEIPARAPSVFRLPDSWLHAALETGMRFRGAWLDYRNA